MPRPGSLSTLDLALVQIDQRLDDRQARGRCRGAAPRAVAAIEAVEHARALLVGHPDPESATTIRTQARSASTPTWMRPPSSVYRWALVSEVGDDLADPPRIGERQRQGGGDVDAELLVLVGDPRPDQLDDLMHGLADVDRAAVDLDVVGLDPGDVEQVVDELDEPVGRARG